MKTLIALLSVLFGITARGQDKSWRGSSTAAWLNQAPSALNIFHSGGSNLVTIDWLTVAHQITGTTTGNDAAGAAAAAQAASQPLDSDLTTIAGLTATTDSFLQAKSSAWASRTVAQVKTDLGLTGVNSGDQTISLTGDVTGSGTGSFAATIPTSVLSVAARTVTAGATVAAMVDTLGGATSGGTGGLARIISPTFTTSIFAPLVIGGTSTTSDLFLQTTSGVGATGADMHFLVGNNGATEAMTILNNGNVGVGTSSPLGKLHLSGSSIIDLYTSDTAAAADTKNWSWQLGSSIGTGTFRLRAINDALSSGKNAVEFIRTGVSSVITAFNGGNVGIGTSAPSAKFNVVASDSAVIILISGATKAIRFGADSTGAYVEGVDSTGVSTYVPVSFGGYPLSFTVAGSEKMRINTDGNAGIGTTVPNRALEINHATGLNLRLTYNDSDGAAATYSDFLMTSGGILGINPTGNNVRFGAVDAAAPAAQTQSVQSVIAGTSNTAGANRTISGSQSTGTGTGGSIILSTSPAGSTGTAQNALVAELTVSTTEVVANLPVRLKGYTVATLPAGTQGDCAFCTDLLAPAFLAVAVGGGSTVGKVFYNGTDWITD